MGTPEEALWRYYRWQDEQRRIELNNQQVEEQVRAYGKGDEAGKLAHIEVFCRQEEARLQKMRSRQGDPFTKPPFTNPPKEGK